MQLHPTWQRSTGSDMPDIVTWEETTAARNRCCDNGIATEPERTENAAWAKCIDSLLEILAWPIKNDGQVVPPKYEVIRAVLEWIVFPRAQFPDAPPTLIAIEPNGGIIISRRSHAFDSDDVINELTFYNDMTVLKGPFIEMGESPRWAPRRFTRPAATTDNSPQQANCMIESGLHGEASCQICGSLVSPDSIPAETQSISIRVGSRLWTNLGFCPGRTMRTGCPSSAPDSGPRCGPRLGP